MSQPAATGRLPENILYFARVLREAGMPVGPGAVLDAVAAVETAGIVERTDFHAILHAVFVKKHEQTVLFDQAFALFWKRRGFMEKLIAMMSPMAEPKSQKKQKAEAGATRIADALFKSPREEKAAPSLDLNARFTVSAREVLQTRDFAQMSAAEIAAAQAQIAHLAMPDDRRKTRRLRPDARGALIDPRASFRRSLRSGGASIDLAFRARDERAPPIVALCDISGSMSDYTRIFLHFLHALTEKRGRVSTFLFGTRLTNVTRALKRRDIDDALSICSAEVKDWSGGTRIGACLHTFNRQWSRRVLGQGATVLLFTDGLEREGIEDLSREADRLHRSARRVIWLNPLLRYDAFEPRAQGIRALLAHVDAFRPIHNLASMGDLVAALSGSDARTRYPRRGLLHPPALRPSF